MKDFYDIWLLAQSFDFDGPTLAAATQATFGARETEIAPAEHRNGIQQRRHLGMRSSITQRAADAK